MQLNYKHMFSILNGVIGPNQILIIILIIVLLFGAKRIPELMKGIGKGIKDFKDAASGKDEENGSSKDNTEK